MSLPPPRGPSKWKLGCGLLAFIVNLGLVLWFLPPVQRAWNLHQQRTISFYSKNWLQPAELLTPRWSWLLRDPEVVAQRARSLATRNFEALYNSSEEWALVLAAWRMQGLSQAQILDLPLGPSIVLGALAAEADPPHWWRSSSWLRQECRARPQGTFHMGLLDAPLVESLFGRFESLDFNHRACLILALSRHDLGLPESERSRVLQAWKAAQPKDNANHQNSLGHALETRQQVLRLLGNRPRELQLTAAYPPRTSPQQQLWLRLAFSDFLRSLGYQVQYLPGEAQPRVEFTFVVQDWDEVAMDSYHTKTVSQRVKRSGRIGKYGSSTSYEDRSYRETTRERNLKAARIPGLRISLQLEQATQTFILPPFGEYAESSLEKDLRFLEGGPISEADWFYWDYFVKVHATQNWRFGIEETRAH